MRPRPYRESDWTAVCEIYDLSKPDEMRGIVEPNEIRRLDADPGMKDLFHASRVRVIETRGRVVGFAGHRGSFITWLFVHPSFRRRGIATTLVREMLGLLDLPITLNVVTTNSAARALYARLGFEVEREFSGAFGGNPCNVVKLRYGEVA